MARRTLRPCAKNGCSNLTRETYCDEHKNIIQKAADSKRPSAAKRGYDSKWNKYRRSFLSKPENMFCVRCKLKGLMTIATVVDHITPHKGDKKLFWDSKNHQGLCERCHNSKTAKEDGGFGNK